VFETIWDGGGIDTYDFSNYSTNLSISLGPGNWSQVSHVQRANLVTVTSPAAMCSMRFSTR
jgi:serralysin